MTLLVIIFGATCFCILQAVYWRSRRGAESRADSLLQKLGGQLEIQDVSLFHKEEERNVIVTFLQQMLIEAGEDPDLGPLINKMILWAMLIGVIFLMLSGSLGSFLFGGGAGALAQLVFLKSRRSKRLGEIEKAVPEALEVMIISLKAGHALPKAISTTASEINGPFAEELGRVSEELKLGRSTEDAFLRLGHRLAGVKTVKTFCVSILVLQQTGGNLVEVLEQLIEALHEQSQYIRKLAAMTAEARTSARILGALPPMFLAATYVVGPDYVEKLFTPGAGYMVSGVALTLYLGGIFWLNSMISTKV